MKQDFGLLVSLGGIRRYRAFRKFGYDANITTTREYIGAPDGPWMPTMAMPLEVVSTSANDAPNGSGASEIELFGLDDSFKIIQERVVLNGLTPVATTNSFRRMYRGYVIQGPKNEGNIDITDGSAIVGSILAEFGQTQLSGYTVPNRRCLQVTSVNMVANTQNPVDIIFWQKPGSQRVVQQYDGLSGPASFPYDPPISFDQMTDLWFTALVKSDIGSAAASVEYVGYLIKQ